MTQSTGAQRRPTPPGPFATVPGAALVAVGVISTVYFGDGGPWWPTATLAVGAVVSAVAWCRYAASTPSRRLRPWAIAAAIPMAGAWLILAVAPLLGALAIMAILAFGLAVAGLGAGGRRGRFRTVPLWLAAATVAAVAVGAGVGLGDDGVFRAVSGVAATGLGLATAALALRPRSAGHSH